jgi:hypothetical protein
MIWLLYDDDQDDYDVDQDDEDDDMIIGIKMIYMIIIWCCYDFDMMMIWLLYDDDQDDDDKVDDQMI